MLYIHPILDQVYIQFSDYFHDGWLMVRLKHEGSLIGMETFIFAVNAGSPRKPGSIADYDPVNNYYGSLDAQQHPNARTGAQVVSFHENKSCL